MKLDQSEWLQQPKPTGSGDQLTQPKDEWGRDAQIYLAQIRAEKIEAEVEAAVMAARVSVSTDEPGRSYSSHTIPYEIDDYHLKIA